MTRRPRTEEDDASFKGLGKVIEHRRLELGLTRTAVAKRADLARSTLEALERGEIEASWGTLRRVAKGLDLSLDQLVRLAEECAPGSGG